MSVASSPVRPRRLRLETFIPKSIVCLREGYGHEFFLNDLLAGLTVGVIALPLAIAFAIASHVRPEQGLYTAIIAGFLISLLGGSRAQIGGPARAVVCLLGGRVGQFRPERLAPASPIARGA